MFKRLFFLAAIVLSTATVSTAQFESGSLTGIVKDPTGALVAGTTVFESERAHFLGLRPDSDMNSIVRQFMKEPGAVHVGA